MLYKDKTGGLHMVGHSHDRKKMVDDQVIRRGVKHEPVVRAMLSVERHRFVETAFRHRAYKDTPLPIGYGQTISQPYMVALMTETLQLEPDDRILEIGTGSGYQAAVLSRICRSVFSVERDPGLARKARKVLDELGYSNVAIRVGDGTIGWKEYAPYDGIIVTAGAPMVPERLLSQMNEGARLVIPVGDMKSQRLYVYQKNEEKFDTTEICSCAFVPLVGKEGWVDGDV